MAKKFSELLRAIPKDRPQRVESRFQAALAAMPLEELRRAKELTQIQLSEKLGVNQSEVSKIEHRSDIYLSTLAEYIEALGGRLEIRAMFPDGPILINQFTDERT